MDCKKIKRNQHRKELTDIWQGNGVAEGKEYAILTNEIYKEWSGMTAKNRVYHLDRFCFLYSC